MQVLVTASAHFAMTDDGSLWTSNASLHYSFWTRYLDVFDGVRLLVRANRSAEPPKGWKTATGPRISVIPIPDFASATGFAQNYRFIRKTVARALEGDDAIILRLPFFIGNEILRSVPASRPYGVEIVADPYDAYAPGANKHPLRPVLRWWFSRVLRDQCAHAAAAAYVTERALQTRYPCPSFSTNYSSIQLLDSDFVPAPRPPRYDPRTFTVITVGTLAQLYKAPDVLIDALGECVRAGTNLRLVVVGDGKYRPELEARAAGLGLQQHICFLGQLTTGDAVREELDQADLFVLPSRQEGLPKAMLEAMARGLPCVGSTVGGIPELLPAEDVVPPGDVFALATTIRAVLANPDRMAAMSARNLDKAREYREESLRARRIALYRTVQAKTEDWLKTRR